MNKEKTSVEGVVVYSAERTGDYGPYFRVGVKDVEEAGGKILYFNLDKSPGDVGQDVNFTVTVDAFKKALQRAGDEPKKPAPNGETKRDLTDARIRKSVALKSASEAVAALCGPKLDSLEDIAKAVTTLAEVFDKWLEVE